MEIWEGNPIRFPKDPPPKISLQGGFRAWEQPASPISNIIIAAAAGSRNILIRLQENSGQTGFGGKTDPDGLTKRIA